jgi:hypothetical protein
MAITGTALRRDGNPALVAISSTCAITASRRVDLPTTRRQETPKIPVVGPKAAITFVARWNGPRSRPGGRWTLAEQDASSRPAALAACDGVPCERADCARSRGGTSFAFCCPFASVPENALMKRDTERRPRRSLCASGSTCCRSGDDGRVPNTIVATRVTLAVSRHNRFHPTGRPTASPRGATATSHHARDCRKSWLGPQRASIPRSAWSTWPHCIPELRRARPIDAGAGGTSHSIRVWRRRVDQGTSSTDPSPPSPGAATDRSDRGTTRSPATLVGGPGSRDRDDRRTPIGLRDEWRRFGDSSHPAHA